MTTVTFESKAGRVISTVDLDVIVERVVVGAPSVRTVYKEVPGRDGVVDYTDYFGDANLGNRLVTIYCGIVFDKDKTVQSDRIVNELHGRKKRIRLSTDPGYYFDGRVTVSEIETIARIGHFHLDCDCYPWKLKEKVTTVEYDLQSSYRDISLRNDCYRTAVPKIGVTGEVTMNFGSRTVSLSEGDHLVDGFCLPHGETVIRAKANGSAASVRFEYQEAKI